MSAALRVGGLDEVISSCFEFFMHKKKFPLQRNLGLAQDQVVHAGRPWSRWREAILSQQEQSLAGLCPSGQGILSGAVLSSLAQGGVLYIYTHLPSKI